MKSKRHDITIASLFAAVICILSTVTIPIGAIPLSLSLFAVILSSTVLDIRQSVGAVAVYILVGTLGIPVFSGFRGGFYVLLGPTGGFIFAYIFTALINSFISDRASKKPLKFIGGLVSLIPCYLCGMLQYSIVTAQNLRTSFFACVLPFIAFDVAKAFLGVAVGLRLKKAIRQNF